MLLIGKSHPRLDAGKREVPRHTLWEVWHSRPSNLIRVPGAVERDMAVTCANRLGRYRC